MIRMGEDRLTSALESIGGLPRKRAESMNYVLAVSDGVIVAVYRPVRWMESKVMPGRLEFEGEKVREGDLVGMDVSSMFAGRSNPVKYIE